MTTPDIQSLVESVLRTTEDDPYTAESIKLARINHLATAAPILARACNEKDAEITRLRAELAEAVKKQPINTSLRLFDLVRYMRAELHQEELITDEEYGQLCAGPMAMSPKGGSPSRQRLEDYDELRKELAEEKRKVEVATTALQMVRAGLCYPDEYRTVSMEALAALTTPSEGGEAE